MLLLWFGVLCGALLSGSVEGTTTSSSLRNGTTSRNEELCDAIYLLNVLPYPNNNEGYDRGFELLPAGHLAASHINNRTDILNGLELKIVDIDSEACGSSLVLFDGHRGIFENIISLPCVLGVIGLFCSGVTETVVPLISHPEYGYAQLSAATSPSLEDNARFPYLFRTIASSEVFNEAVVAMIDAFNWTQVSVIYDSLAILSTSTGTNFEELINSNPNITLLASIPILDTTEGISDVFEILNSVVSTIGYYSVSASESVRILCDAFQRNQIYLNGYVYIFQGSFGPLGGNLPCRPENLFTAFEGVFTLQYRLATTEQSDLVSGMSYETYRQQYLEALRRFENETGMDLAEDNDFANSLYDQVWAFALAMNNSLDTLDLSNDSFENVYQVTPKVREILTHELKQVSFDGTTGRIQFGEEQEVPTSVDIFQIRSGRLVLIGIYDSFRKDISFTDNFDKQNLPDDTPDTVQDLVPLWLGALALTFLGALLILIMVNLVLLICLRKSPEIRSTSLYISLIILAGCFFLSISSVAHAVFSSFQIEAADFVGLCYVDSWLSVIGFNLIIVSLLFRLLRIFNIFRSYHTIGKYWTDKYIIFYIFLLSSIIVIILIIWAAVDPIEYGVTVRLILPLNQPPFVLENAFCSSDFILVWTLLTYGWTALLLVVVVILAIKTRHVKQKNFKDTKKVILFVFIESAILLICTPLSFILMAVDQLDWAFFFKWLAAFTFSLLCQLFLFMPKFFPVLLAKKGNVASVTFTGIGGLPTVTSS